MFQIITEDGLVYSQHETHDKALEALKQARADAHQDAEALRDDAWEAEHFADNLTITTSND